MGQLTEHVNPEMIKRTKNKFKVWDKIVKSNLLEKGTEEERARVYKLLEDPTIYAYAFFKDLRRVNQPFRAYSYQDMIMNDSALKKPGGRVIFCSGNQLGKSVSLVLLALHSALLNPGKTYVLVSLTLPQSKDLLLQLKSFLNNSAIDKYDVVESETKTEVYFKHFEEYEEYDKKLDKTFTKVKELPKSRIICIPATGAALGYPVDGLFIDELAFFENGEWFYKQVAQPRTYFTKGFIVVFSNPNGQQGIFYELWQDEDFSRYRFNFLDCPFNTQEEYDKYVSKLTRDEIDSTLDAVFTNPKGGFLTLEERREIQHQRPNILPSVLTQPIYIFFDWAKVLDRTVRFIGVPIRKGENEWADEVYIYEMLEYPEGTPYTQIIDVDLKNLILDVGANNVAMVGWDNTGVGRGLEDFVKRVEQLGIMAMPVEFSLQNKSRIYTLFKLLVENNRISLPYVKECDKQLSMLRFVRTSRGYLQVHHQSERDRDDFCDCVAGICSLIIQPENPPVTVTIISEEDAGEIRDDDNLGFINW